MLVCANRESEALNNESGLSQNLMITGCTLMVVPFITILYSFISYVMNLQLDMITSGDIDAFVNGVFYQIERLLSNFDSSTRKLIWFIFAYMHFLILVLFFSLSEPNSKTNYWIRRSRTLKDIYELFIIIFFVSLVTMWLKSIDFDTEDLINLDMSGISFMATILSFVIGLMFNIFGSLIISLNRKSVDNVNKIILDLNHKIIFYKRQNKNI